MSRLVLIDGNAILHRAFHALPPMTNSAGEPTNAVYGFVAMLIRVIEELKPTHLAVTFDRPGGTFRNELYKEYQAQRPKMDDALAFQVKSVHDATAALGFPIYEKDGFEADDVLGTIASQVAKDIKILRDKDIKKENKKNTPNISISQSPNIEVVIVTGDRDLLQLVNDHVKLFMPVKGGLGEAKLYGEKEAKERMGVPPSQITDLKGLMGDPSDNYPGIDGIGPKTAITLLKKFGSVENLLKNIDKVENQKLREKLINGKKDLLVSYKLATVVTDAPVDFTLEKAKLPADFLTEDVVKLFGHFEFRTLLKRLSKLSGKEVTEDPRFRKDDNKKNDKKKIDENQMGLF